MFANQLKFAKIFSNLYSQTTWNAYFVQNFGFQVEDLGTEHYQKDGVFH